MMRLDKFLAKTGLGSRTEVRKLIRSGQVTVDGVVIKDGSFTLNPQAAKVTASGTELEYREYHYLMLNKPLGVISATEDKLHATVLELLPPTYQHLKLFPVGRLDKDTQGLLLLTDDGQLTHNLLAPKKHVPKTYLALVQGLVDKADQEAFAKGIPLSDFVTLPARLEILEAGPQSQVEVTIYEGKFHQVKRMFHAVGKEVLALTRIRFGPLSLDAKLAPGDSRELTPEELTLLQEWRQDNEPLLHS
jgi:16S rRNA pseudouridine516 synthase